MLNSFEIELPSYNIQEVYRSEYQMPSFGGLADLNKPTLWLALIAFGIVYHAMRK